jgi:hypothetical protein
VASAAPTQMVAARARKVLKFISSAAWTVRVRRRRADR